MKTTLHFLLWFFVIVQFSTSSVIKIEEGGYTDILVAIHSNVAEDTRILEHLKSLLTNTSAFLYNATRGQAYFKEIIIAIPENWTNYVDYETVVSNQFEHAHIRIDLENDYDGPEPFTRHFRDCGEPGEFIQLSPNYLQTLSSPTDRNTYGIPERRMVHEWAHFRYGVFDEHPMLQDKRFPTYYRDGHKVVPNTCNQEIGKSSYFETIDGQPCDPRESDACLRIVGNSVTASASLMYSTSLPSVTSFCDDSAERRHNRKAITKHNIKCKYKSTWEVISAHEDFQKKRKDSSPSNTIPHFRIIRQSSSAGQCVLVLDVSGSMKDVPIQLLKESASRFIADQAPDNITIGIVSFSSTTDIVHPLTVVNSHTRKSLVNSVSKLSADGGTAIGAGLLRGLQVLESNKRQAIEGSVILLITDGEETDKPLIEEVIPTLVAKKVVVKTIAYGEKATEKLSNLTKATGGQGFFFKNIDDVKASTESLDAAFMGSLTLQSDIAFEPISIASKSFAMHKAVKNFSTIVDNELGRNTVFTITSSDITQIKVDLLSPSGRRYTDQSPEYNKNEALKRIVFRFPDSEVGQWHSSVLRLGSIPVNVGIAVTSEPKNSKIQPVRIKTFLSSLTEQRRPTVKIYAMVTKGNLPVKNAEVEATIITPNQKSWTIVLRDNGKGPDSTKNDGLYTGYFTAFDSSGRYSVSAKVSGTNKVRVIRRKKRKNTVQRNRRSANQQNGSSTVSNDYEYYDEETDDEDEVYEEEAIDVFERTAIVGLFNIEDWDPKAGDLIPPVRVTDLEVNSVDVMKNGSRIVTVQWTSPGDDENNGNASYIELRVSTDFDRLLARFNTTTELNNSLIVDGNLTPQPANEIQVLTLMLPISLFRVFDHNRNASNFSDSIYISLRAGDESGNVGDLSNIATAHFGDVDVFSSSSGEDKYEQGIHPGIVILIVVACGAVLLAILMLCLSQKRKKNYRPVFLMPTTA